MKVTVQDPLRNIATLSLIAMLMGAGIYGCGGGGSTTVTSGSSTTGSNGGGSTTGSNGSQPGNPVPMIADISPSTSMTGGAPFLLTINGSNFIGGSTVNFGGLLVTVLSDSSSQLLVSVPAAAIATAGAVPVRVTNPAPGGGTSNPVNFTISGGSPSINFTAVGNMTTARADHIAVLLPNGKVLIAGGVSNAGSAGLASAELYDPSSGMFTPTGDMTIQRSHPAAVLLPNGKVLVVGTQDLSAELYDPSTGTFTATGNMISGAADPYVALPLILLQNGKVLVGTVNAQIYDPTTGTFGLAGAYSDANPLWFTSNSLQDGRILLTGCVTPSTCSAGATELYDPGTGKFSFTGPLKQWGDVNTATLLMSGKVLFVGNEENDGLLADAELYDAAAGTFTSVGTATAPHEFAASVRLANGSVLITGGQLPGGFGSAGTDLYDPASGEFTSAGNMTVGRHEHTSTLLPDGTVLIAGGHSSWPASTSSAEIYKPTAP